MLAHLGTKLALVGGQPRVFDFVDQEIVDTSTACARRTSRCDSARRSRVSSVPHVYAVADVIGFPSLAGDRDGARPSPDGPCAARLGRQQPPSSATLRDLHDPGDLDGRGPERDQSSLTRRHVGAVPAGAGIDAR